MPPGATLSRLAIEHQLDAQLYYIYYMHTAYYTIIIYIYTSYTYIDKKYISKNRSISQ